MASLTYRGESDALIGTGGGIATQATALKLYTGASVPAKTGVDGTDFIEVAGGGGYTTGGITITSSSWTLSIVGGVSQITLANQVWTASGSGITNVGGAYIVDAEDNVLAWWDRGSPITVAAGDTLPATGLYISL